MFQAVMVTSILVVSSLKLLVSKMTCFGFQINNVLKLEEPLPDLENCAFLVLGFFFLNFLIPTIILSLVKIFS